MPLRTTDTRVGRLFEERRHVLARPGRPLPKGPTQPPDDDERAITPIHPRFDDWPFDFEPPAVSPGVGGER